MAIFGGREGINSFIPLRYAHAWHNCRRSPAAGRRTPPHSPSEVLPRNPLGTSAPRPLKNTPSQIVHTAHVLCKFLHVDHPNLQSSIICTKARSSPTFSGISIQCSAVKPWYLNFRRGGPHTEIQMCYFQLKILRKPQGSMTSCPCFVGEIIII